MRLGNGLPYPVWWRILSESVPGWRVSAIPEESDRNEPAGNISPVFSWPHASKSPMFYQAMADFKIFLEQV